VLGAFSQYEKAMLVQKLKGARQRAKAKQGRCEGEKPFGTLPGESSVITRMQALRSEGMSYQKIAAALDGTGVRPRYGERWNPIVVKRNLRANVRSASLTRELSCQRPLASSQSSGIPS
jgi:DNA invertase Pin-like site-specific DNA recombinase